MLIWARQLFTKAALTGRTLVVYQIQDQTPAGKFERGFNRVCKPLNYVALGHQAIYNNRDVVLEGLFQWFGVGQGNCLAIDRDSRESLGLK